MTVNIDVQYCVDEAKLPSVELFSTALSYLFNELKLEESSRREVVIRIVDTIEMAALNERWRHKAYATNVLAFPFGDAPLVEASPLGDVVICASVVRAEAREQGKPFVDRMMHMLIHGTLHLLGYDHQNEDEAGLMEGIETQVLVRLGYARPYESTDDSRPEL